ncbi:UNVERIFIED_CONTAM: RNA-binding protein 42 [Sesamum calycinum]|uniref:RNA-binding protein 42 n=1 Tax=Sesamum calycinum TaxID=2727403 RepID=A0AAW2QP23_9LAMI
MATVPSTTAAAAASSSSQYTYPAATTSYFPTPFHLQTPPPPPVPYIGAAPPPTVPSVPLPVYPAPPTAQQLFQRDAQTITPEAIESVKAALASSDIEHKAETKKKAIPRKAAGHTWEDPTLAEWPENDYRLFCGDLGNEVNDDVLSKAFSRFPSFNMARVVRDKRTGKTKGYGKYVGNRPIKLRKSTWTERTDAEALERQKNQSQKKTKLPKKSVLHK